MMPEDDSNEFACTSSLLSQSESSFSSFVMALRLRLLRPRLLRLRSEPPF